MAQTLLITLREGLEAALIVGIVLAYLARTNNRQHFPKVWWGVTVAVLLSLGVGAVTFAVAGGLAGSAEEIVEGVAMLTAAVVLSWMVLWMKRQAVNVRTHLQAQVDAALRGRSALALAALAFVAVGREGLETALFLFAATRSAAPLEATAGGILGLAGAVFLGVLVYRGGRRLPLSAFFSTTGLLFLLMAAGLLGKATRAFQAAGWLPGTIAVWDTSLLLAQDSALGSLLYQLLGYTASPSLLQVSFSLGLGVAVGYLWVATDRPLVPAPPLSLATPFYASQMLYRTLRSPYLPTILSGLMGVGLVILLGVALLGIPVGPFTNQGPLTWGPFSSPENENNFFNFAMWILWLPLLSLSAVVLGRWWCGNLCPLRLIAEGARTLGDFLLGKGSTTPYLRLGWLLPLSFILITFLVKALPIQTVATYGALLFLGIFGVAVVASIFLRRGSWCRYLCPIGGWLARITRLSALELASQEAVCATCEDKPCLKEASSAGRCPAYLNPSRLETNRYCLACWRCIRNCPEERSSLKLRWRWPGAELLAGRSLDVWESLFVAAMLGMYVAVGHRSLELAQVPWPLLYFGLIVGAVVLYFLLCALTRLLARVPFREALRQWGYIFLPMEFGTAVIAFGDDALEFFGIVQPAAAFLLTLGFVWSLALLVATVRRVSPTPGRALVASVPLLISLAALLLLWMAWYASGTVIDIT